MKVTLNGVRIRSVATAIPNQAVSLADLAKQFGQREVARIAMSTGIKTLRIANAGTKASDLCEAAANQLFECGFAKRDCIDGIVFVSQTPDYIMPATSCLLQSRLGLSKDVVAFDINYGCSGYLYGLYQAALLVASGSCQQVLVCTGDTMSQHCDPDDHKVRMVLGDAGAATLVEAGEGSWSFDMHTDGSGYDKLIIPKQQDGQDGYLHMDGAAIMEFALSRVHESVEATLQEQTWTLADVNQVLLHQPNTFMLNYLRKKLGLPKDKLPIAVAQYGNTGPASIPLTLCDTFAGEQVNLGKVVMSGFGVGLSWGSVAMDCGLLDICPIVTVG